MSKTASGARLAFFIIATIAITAVYLTTLYKLQIIEGEAYYEQSRNNIVTRETVLAARGSIMDRYGRVLVTNKVCNNLYIDPDEMFYTDGNVDHEKANTSVLELATTVVAYGDSYTDELPITRESPFEFTEMTDVQRTRLFAWMERNDLPLESSAVEVMAKMRERYRIDNNYTSEETRIIAGIRYEVNVRYVTQTSDYIFAEDVSMELITTLMESALRGIIVKASYVREYNTEYAAHVLGYIGMMNGEEYKEYSKTGQYAFDALVGKAGAEYAFEKYLHGVNGLSRTTSTATGVVTSTVYIEEPVPGNNVYLTIDIGLQESAENALNSFITKENEARQQINEDIATFGGLEEDIEQYITGGAVVAVDVRSGEPIAIASWPSYDLSNFLQNYAEISTAENNPLYNKATMGTYAPGSTFKPVTAIAALDMQKISTTSTFTCDAIFTKYQTPEEGGYAPRCWIYGAGRHGDINVTQAVNVSCNCFFYEVGDMMNIDQLYEYATMFGLGEATGIELGEFRGNMSNRVTHEEIHGVPWYLGDMLQASIGQSDSLFTPLQIAEYCAVLANGGTRYSASMLRSVRSFDFTETVYEREAEVLSVVETEQEYFDAVRFGMYGVANDDPTGNVYHAFYGSSYSVAAKTGTAQVGEASANNAVFICFAPYENPEIAVAVVVEKGSAGSLVAEIARSVLDYYFAFKSSTTSLEGEGRLLR